MASGVAVGRRTEVRALSWPFFQLLKKISFAFELWVVFVVRPDLIGDMIIFKSHARLTYHQITNYDLSTNEIFTDGNWWTDGVSFNVDGEGTWWR